MISRLTKRLTRQVMVSWREQPTRYDIEALQANTYRVGLVIKVRWALVAVLALYSVIAGWAYTMDFPWDELWPNMVIPGVALAFVLMYNTYYQLTYRRLGNIAVLNHVQLLFDALVVTVLVYYSGGVHSWFWSMYPLFILEAAFILPRRSHVWIIAAACALFSGIVYGGEYLGWLPHVEMPFVNNPQHHDATYVTIRHLWQLAVMGGTATVASLMTAAIRTREQELAESSIIDDKTGLYDRRYTLRALTSEVLRAQRDNRSLHLILMDIDDFGTFNKTFGIDKGDKILADIAHKIAEETGMSGAPTIQSNVVGRFGGEEFAVVYVELQGEGYPSRENAEAMAKRLRSAVEEVRIDDAGVTVSIGLASFPEDGSSADELLNAVDEALHQAVVSGGNTVVSSRGR